jgi:hypothetical protein
MKDSIPSIATMAPGVLYKTPTSASKTPLSPLCYTLLSHRINQILCSLSSLCLPDYSVTPSYSWTVSQSDYVIRNDLSSKCEKPLKHSFFSEKFFSYNLFLLSNYIDPLLAVAAIRRVVTPSQIVYPIIQFVSVNMVYLWVIVRIIYESLRNQSVDVYTDLLDGPPILFEWHINTLIVSLVGTSAPSDVRTYFDLFGQIFPIEKFMRVSENTPAFCHVVSREPCGV